MNKKGKLDTISVEIVIIIILLVILFIKNMVGG